MSELTGVMVRLEDGSLTVLNIDPVFRGEVAIHMLKNLPLEPKDKELFIGMDDRVITTNLNSADNAST
jgi:hypothetical protein